jgi:hypothetical protein
VEIFLIFLVILLAFYVVTLGRRLKQSTRRWQDLTARLYALEIHLKDLKGTADQARLVQPAAGQPLQRPEERAAPHPTPATVAGSALAGTAPEHSQQAPAARPAAPPSGSLSPGSPPDLTPPALEAAASPQASPDLPGFAAEPARHPSAGEKLRSLTNLEEMLGTNWLNNRRVGHEPARPLPDVHRSGVRRSCWFRSSTRDIGKLFASTYETASHPCQQSDGRDRPGFHCGGGCPTLVSAAGLFTL